tara:strand:- start:12812 stop:13249 length:438 start_codon:yes stop_codon:yes gene_type:complete
VKCFRKGELDDIAPGGRLGIFGLNARSLNALGLSGGVITKRLYGTRVKLPKFYPPLTIRRFLASPQIQYNAFSKLQSEAMHSIKSSDIKNRIGELIGGEPLTMSGLLGLVSQAGVKGARSWLNRPDERSRFPFTTKIFIKTNGIF